MPMNKYESTYNNFRIAVQPAFEDVFTQFYFAANNSEETIARKQIPSYQTIMAFNSGVRFLKIIVAGFLSIILFPIENCASVNREYRSQFVTYRGQTWWV